MRSFLIITVALLLAPLACLAQPETAVQSDVFVSQMCVQLHAEDTDYINQQSVLQAALVTGGWRCVRDGGRALTSNSAAMIAQYGIYNSYTTYVSTNGGYRLGWDLITWPANFGSSNYPTGTACDELTLSPISTILTYFAASNIDSFEGMNEFNNPAEYNAFVPGCVGVSGNTWQSIDTNYQSALYADEKGNPSVSALPVLGGTFVGTISGILSWLSTLNFPALHPYPLPGGLPLSAYCTQWGYYSTVNGTTGSCNASSPAYIATETGYYTNPDNNAGVDQRAQSFYWSEMYFEFIKTAGLAKVYAYELGDECSLQPSYSGFLGFVDCSGNPKLALGTIGNINKILSDPGSTFSPGSLTFSLGSVPGTVHHYLLQKRNGTFELEINNYLSVYNTATNSDITNTPVATTLGLGITPRQVNIYDPTSSSSPIASYYCVNAIPLSIVDHAIIVEVIP